MDFFSPAPVSLLHMKVHERLKGSYLSLTMVR